MLLLWGFRTYPSTANRHKKNGAPNKQDAHDSYEVCLADRGATAFCMCLLLLAPQSMPHNELWRISTEAYSPKCLEDVFSEVRRRATIVRPPVLSQLPCAPAGP